MGRLWITVSPVGIVSHNRPFDPLAAKPPIGGFVTRRAPARPGIQLSEWGVGHSMELSFIVDCLAHHLDPDRPLPEPPADLDWDTANHLLVRHGLGGYSASWERLIRASGHLTCSADFASNVIPPCCTVTTACHK